MYIKYISRINISRNFTFGKRIKYYIKYYTKIS